MLEQECVLTYTSLKEACSSKKSFSGILILLLLSRVLCLSWGLQIALKAWENLENLLMGFQCLSKQNDWKSVNTKVLEMLAPEHKVQGRWVAKEVKDCFRISRDQLDLAKPKEITL